MQWRVGGYNATTGLEQSVTVEADDPKHAAAVAKTRGVLPAQVTLIGSPVPATAPPLQYASTGPGSPPPTPEPDTETPQAPPYTGLILTSLLCLVVGGVAILTGAYLLLFPDLEPEQRIMGVPLILSGLLFCFIAFAGHALRDIARNSWRKPS